MRKSGFLLFISLKTEYLLTIWKKSFGKMRKEPTSPDNYFIAKPLPFKVRRTTTPFLLS